MSRELIAELRRKKNVYGIWEEGQATWEGFRNVVRACREETRKPKVHLELNLATEVLSNS